MKMIFKKMRVGLVLVGVAMLAGCSLGVNESTSYSIPNWTADGRIIARKVYLKTEHTLVSNSEIRAYQNSIVVMDDNGGHEQKLFDVDENGISLVEMSPSGNYVGYINSMSLLKVFKNEGGRWNLKWTKTVDSSTNLVKFRPDEMKVYLSRGRAAFYLFENSSGSQLRYEETGGGGCFINNSEILMQDSIPGFDGGARLSRYAIDAHTQTRIDIILTPRIYVASENAVYGIGALDMLKVEMGTGRLTTYNFTYTPYKYEDFVGQHLSPDGKKIVMSYGGSIDPAGIFLLDINNSTLSRIK